MKKPYLVFAREDIEALLATIILAQENCPHCGLADIFRYIGQKLEKRLEENG